MSGRISEPNVSLSIIPSTELVGVQDQKVLIVGQLLAAGSATSGDLQQNIQNDGSEDTLFGASSHVAGMIREFKKLNGITRLDAIGLSDGGSAVKGTSSFAITGTATEDGTIEAYVGSKNNHVYSISVTSGDTATVIGAAIEAAITADTKAPFTGANVTGTVTMTAENGGSLCNDWNISWSGTVAGVSVTVTGWASGATDPILTSVLDVIANIRYQTIVWPSVYALTTVEALLNARFNVTNDVMDGVAVQTLVDTLANLETATSTLNSASLVIVGNKAVSRSLVKGGAVPEIPDIISAEVAALRSLRLTDSAPISQFVTTASRSDQYGGIGIASLPYFNTSMPNVDIGDAIDFFTTVEIDEMVDNALSVVGPNRAYTGTVMGEVVTTYLTDGAGNEDISFKFLNSVDTSSTIREYYFNNFKSRYAQSRLTDGDLISGRDMANEASIRAFCNELYDELAEAALVQSGSDAKTDFDNNLSISVSISTGTVTIDMAPLLVTQLRTIIGTIQVNFGS